MKILCLDVSSVSTGYSVLNNSRLLKSQCGVIKNQKEELLGKRLGQFEQKLKKVLEKTKPDLIILEDIFYRNARTYKVLAMHHGIVFLLSWKILGKCPFYMKTLTARKAIKAKDKKDVFSKIVSKFKLSRYDYKEHNDITDSIVLGVAYFKNKKKGGKYNG